LNTYKRHRFPLDTISYAVLVYYRFNLSYRDVEDLLAERGVIVSREAIRHRYPRLAELMGQALYQIWQDLYAPVEEESQRFWRYILS
jgi:transposase-like protein